MEERPTEADHASDAELVRDARRGNKAAFETLTARHFPMVYALTFARLGAREAAEDLAQEVFLLAYLHLDALTEPAHFAAWLGRIARNEGVSWLRRSQSASRLVRLVPLDDLPAEPAAPASQGARTALEADEETRALHEALFRLPEALREVVVLHYFEDLSKAEIAERLEVHPATVGRQIEKALKAMKRTLEPILRRAAPAFRHSGKAAARTTLLVGAVAAMSAPAKAALLAEAGASAAILAAATQTVAVATSWHTIFSGGFLMSVKTQIVAVLVALCLIAAVTYHQMAQTSPAPKQAAKPTAAATQTPTPAAQEPAASGPEAFDALYRLDDDQVLKRIAPPFLPERDDYYRSREPAQVKAAGLPDFIAFHWNGKLIQRSAGFSNGKGIYPLSGLLCDCGLASYEFEGPKDLLDANIAGDWLIREGARRDAVLQALSDTLKDDLGRDIRFAKGQVEREVIVARGQYAFHPIPGNQLDPRNIHVYAENLDQRTGGYGGFNGFLEDLGKGVGLRVIDEPKTPLSVTAGWSIHSDARSVGSFSAEPAKLSKILDNLSKQTSLTFTVEKRLVDVWFVSEGTGPESVWANPIVGLPDATAAPGALPVGGPVVPVTDPLVPAK